MQSFPKVSVVEVPLHKSHVLSKIWSKWLPRHWRQTCIHPPKLSITRTHSSLGISLIFHSPILSKLLNPVKNCFLMEHDSTETFSENLLALVTLLLVTCTCHLLVTLHWIKMFSNSLRLKFALKFTWYCSSMVVINFLHEMQNFSILHCTWNWLQVNMLCLFP